MRNVPFHLLALALLAGCSNRPSFNTPDKPSQHNARAGLDHIYASAAPYGSDVDRIAKFYRADLRDMLEKHPAATMDMLQTIAILDEQAGVVRGGKH